MKRNYRIIIPNFELCDNNNFEEIKIDPDLEILKKEMLAKAMLAFDEEIIEILLANKDIKE